METYEKLGSFYLGKTVAMEGQGQPPELVLYDSKDLTTHAVIIGMTGSGKTEVYLNLVADTVARQKTALVLVPEIALISQMERRFRARFGDKIAVLHSGLSAGERLDQWMRILRQEAALAGSDGAVLWSVSAKDGSKRAEYELPAPPIFDGLSAARGRLYISGMDGVVRSFGE